MRNFLFGLGVMAFLVSGCGFYLKIQDSSEREWVSEIQQDAGRSDSGVQEVPLEKIHREKKIEPVVDSGSLPDNQQLDFERWSKPESSSFPVPKRVCAPFVAPWPEGDEDRMSIGHFFVFIEKTKFYQSLPEAKSDCIALHANMSDHEVLTCVLGRLIRNGILPAPEKGEEFDLFRPLLWKDAILLIKWMVDFQYRRASKARAGADCTVIVPQSQDQAIKDAVCGLYTDGIIPKRAGEEYKEFSSYDSGVYDTSLKHLIGCFDQFSP